LKSNHLAACGGYFGHGNVIGWMMARAAVDGLVDGHPPPDASLAL
jgi:glycine/D-amino acid oxidase-like deaminating enzyme